jgi:Na+/H+ antiporter NhaD/arsenite permease-like protein
MLAARIIAVAIFLVMFIMIIMEKFEKQYITLTAGLVTIVGVFGIGGALAGSEMNGLTALIDTLNVKSIFTPSFWYSAGSEEASSGISWSTIFFLCGMMIMVEGMARTGFFRWLCMKIAKAVNYKTIAIFIAFMIMSFVLAMFIDSITVILFLAAVTIELSKLLGFNPVPMIMSEVFCANLGGSATMCGDPPNIIIGTAFGYSFTQFLTNTGLIAAICLVVVVIFFYFVNRKELAETSGTSTDLSKMPDPKSAILDKKGFIISWIIFLIAVVLLVSHATTGLTVATIGIGIAILTVITTFIIAGTEGLKHIFKGVDYKTLLFFTGLFVVVGGLEQTGILELIAAFIETVSGGNAYVMVAIIIWVSAIASAFIDNIPFAATMVPVISSLSAVSGVPLTTLAWALAMGTDIGGSATPIGASANVVGCAAAAKAGHPINWATYCKKNVPATIIVLVISTVLIFVRYI